MKTRQQFEKLADNIVKKNYGKDLSVAVAKEAKDSGLSVDGVKSLLHMVNTLASLHHFDHADDSADNFQLAEPRKVLRIVFNLGDDSEKSKVEEDNEKEDDQVTEKKVKAKTKDFDEAPEKAKEASALEDPALAAVRDQLSPLNSYVSLAPSTKLAMRRQGVVRAFEQSKAAALAEYHSLMDRLVQDNSSIHADGFDQLAKEAAAVHGDAVTGVLTKLSSRMPTRNRWSGEQVSPTTIVDTAAPGHVKIARLVELAVIYEAYDKAIGSMEG